MEENIVHSEVKKNLSSFYVTSQDWLNKYEDIATNFDTELVERKDSFRDLDGILEDYTVLVLTANSVEQNILTQKLYQEVNAGSKNPKKLSEIYADGCVYQFAPIQNVNIVHIHPNSTSSFTAGGSADAVRSALERFRPKIVVSLGVAFGIDPEKQKLGDVLLSSGIIPYDVFNKDTNGIISLRSEDKCLTHEALSAWNVLMRSSSFPLEKNSERRSLIDEELKFKWQFGTMLSGGSVLSNDKKKKSLLEAAAKCGEEHIIGGEMEGIGIYSECSKPDIPCIVIKGICDWAAEKNSWEEVIKDANKNQDKRGNISLPNQSNDSIKDCVQAYAMDHATEALLRLLRFDSRFLDVYSKKTKNNVPNPRKLKQMFGRIMGRIRLSFNSLKNILSETLFECISLIAGIISISFIISTLPYFKEHDNNTRWIIYCIVLLTFAGAGVFVIKRIIAIHPIEVSRVWANFRIEHTATSKELCIRLNDSRRIFNVVFSRLLITDRVLQESQEQGDFKRGDLIGSCSLNDLNKKTALQIDYELANGDHYVHLISKRQDSSNMCCERVFLVDGSKYRLVGIQKIMSSVGNESKSSITEEHKKL